MKTIFELVRDLRSSLGYIDGDFQTFALDIASPIYDAFIEADGHNDYVLNLSASKRVRSEQKEKKHHRILSRSGNNIYGKVKKFRDYQN